MAALMLALPAWGQAPAIQWQQAFGGTGVDQAYTVKQTGDGGYIIGGSSASGISGNKSDPGFGAEDFWIVKVDTNGVKQWDKTFGGTNSDVLQVVQPTTDGGYILGGYSLSGISGNKTSGGFGSTDFWVVKTDAGGNKLWDRSFGGSDIDALFTLQQTTDGGYLLGGNSFSGISGNKTNAAFGNSDYWVVKISSTGSLLWERSFGGTDSDNLYSLQQTADGGYILGGESISPASGNKTSAGYGSYDFWVVKLDPAGNKQWDRAFGGADSDDLYSLQQAADGGYILAGISLSGVTGSKTTPTFGGGDFWLVKIDTNGAAQWDRDFGGVDNDQAYSVQQTTDGGYIVGGYSASGVSGNRTNASFGANDYWIVKTDSTGVRQWDEGFGGASGDFLNGVRQTADGGYVLAGYSNSDVSGNKTNASFGGPGDFWVLKLGAVGGGGGGIAPGITSQPSNRTVGAGTTVSFSVTATGTAPLVYRWRLNGTNLAGGTSSTLTLSNVQASQAGNYSVVITNLYGTITSSNAVLTVTNAAGTPPFITLQPTNRTVSVGQATTFSVFATGTAPLRYQWKFNGTNLVGKTNLTLTLTNIQVSQAGNYFVTITNAFGATNSATAVLTVGGSGGSCQTPPSGLIGWWKLEGNGDDSAAGNNGTVFNGVYGTGIVGQGVSFNPDGVHWTGVQVADQSAYMLTNALTIEGWVIPRGNGYIIFWRGDHRPGLDPYAVSMQGDNRLRFAICDGAGQSAYIDTLLVYNQWWHFAATFNNGTLSLYTNGVLAAQGTTTFRPFAALDPSLHPGVGIGNLNDGGNDFPFIGDIDEISLYNRALSATEIQGIYNAGSAGKCSNLSPPIITSQPVNQTVPFGQTATFSVGATGTGPLSYQWKFNGTNLPGATSASLTLNNVQLSQAGGYSVTITNPLGSTNSVTATLTVTAMAPFILVPPTNRTVNVGQNTTFFVSAGGTAPLSYQWRFNGTDIPGATSAVLTLTNVQAGQAGDYSVHVSNVAGSTNSVAAVLTVNVPPAITTQPSGQSVTVGQTATFTVVATGTAPLHYQWTFNGTNLAGATGSSLVLTNVQASQAGTYAVSISNAAGSTNSLGAALTVNVPPSITSQPTNQTVTVGETATFNVAATGTAPLSYQWRFNGGDIAGATNAALVLANVQTNQAGLYSVRVSNVAGSTNSAAARLTVNRPPVADATATTPLVISVNGSNAVVVLDGSLSSDPDNDPLQYLWYQTGQTNVFTNGIVAVVTLPVGTNAITLHVSDGWAADEQTITVEVITLDQAVGRLIDLIDPKRQSLIATLRAALASIDRNDPTSALNQLLTFQHKVEVQLMPVDPATAQTLIDDAQAIIDAIEGAGGGHGARTQVDAQKVNGRLHLDFAGSHGRIYIIEASANLVNWDKIGVAKENGAGKFEFDDPQSGQMPFRYYRITVP